MRWLRLILPVLATAAAFVLAPISATAATTYSDSISGYEYAATSTQGSFAGTASGDLPGYWHATVDHTPLDPDATITGGDFYLSTYLAGALTTVSGEFAYGGSVTLENTSTGCTNQYYAVKATLDKVRFGAMGGGTGSFSGTLTHYRALVLGHCVTYSAKIAGSLSLARP